MHEDAICVGEGDVLEVGNVLDGGLKTMLFPLRITEEQVGRRCGDGHDVRGRKHVGVFCSVLGDMAAVSTGPCHE